jgi:xylulokinase
MFLGIDVGTSSVKTVLLDDCGIVVAEGSSSLEISRPYPLWSEQNPTDWWVATNAAVQQLDPKLRELVRGVGLSGQMHGAVVLDERDEPLRPAILWNDGRSIDECIALQDREPRFLSKGGNLVMPGFTAPKLMWLMRHEPDIFNLIRKVLLPKDYVRLRMTGEYASDMSDAAGTLWLDVGARTWCEPLLRACNLSLDQMPVLFEGPQVTGVLRAETAEAWGMSRVPVVAGGSDNAAAALGAGVTAEGEALLSLGTSGVIFLAGCQFRPYPERAVHAFCHALPERWHQMSVMLSAASAIDWGATLLGLDSATALIALAEGSGRIGAPEQFLPYLSGERTPHNNPHAAGVLFGLSHNSHPGAIAQALLEGVAFGFVDGFKALLDSGAQIQTISVLGGGARSLYWGRILANAIGRPLVYRESAAISAALGAARLARHGIDEIPLDDAFAAPPVVAVIEPTQADSAALHAKFENFKQLYRDLTHQFRGRA